MYVIVSIAYMSINSIYASSSGLYSVVLSQSWDDQVAVRRSTAAATAAVAAAAAEFPPPTSYCINSRIFCAELWKKHRILGIFLWSKCRIIWRFYHIVISGVCRCVLVCWWGRPRGAGLRQLLPTLPLTQYHSSRILHIKANLCSLQVTSEKYIFCQLTVLAQYICVAVALWLHNIVLICFKIGMPGQWFWYSSSVRRLLGSIV